MLGLGCLSFCLLGDRFGTNLGLILDTFGHLWCHLGWSLQAGGSIWTRLGQPGYPNELLGTPVQAGTPIWGDLLDPGARKLASCGGLWILGPESWHPVAACGGLWHPSRSPIEEDKMIR